MLKNFFKDFENEDNFNYYIQLGLISSFLPTFLILFFIKAYYGKFFDSSDNKKESNSLLNNLRKFFPVIPSHISWIIQECPCVFITLFYLIKYQSKISILQIAVIFPFLVHYIHRSFIFPFIIHSSKNYPLEITLMALSFCIFNSIIINRSIIIFSEYDSNDYLTIFIGIMFTFNGMFINVYHDYSMSYQRAYQNRKSKGTHYIIPRGFLFEFISCPNYFGELIEWFGFTILSGTFSGFVFFICSFANLFPRAIQYHKWYQTKFKEEFATNIKLKRRKAIIPLII